MCAASVHLPHTYLRWLLHNQFASVTPHDNVLTAVEDSPVADTLPCSEATTWQHHAAYAADDSQDNDRIAAVLAPPPSVSHTTDAVDTAAPSLHSLRLLQRPSSISKAPDRIATADSADYSLCSPCVNRETNRAEDTKAVEALPDEPCGWVQQPRKKKYGKCRRAGRKQQSKGQSQKPPLVMSKCYADVVGCAQQEEDSVSIRSVDLTATQQQRLQQFLALHSSLL